MCDLNFFSAVKCLYFFVCAVSALQVIQQSTGWDMGWEDDPCSPRTWEHITCEGNRVTSLYVNHFHGNGNDTIFVSFDFSSFIDANKLFLPVQGTFRHENEINYSHFW